LLHRSQATATLSSAVTLLRTLQRIDATVTYRDFVEITGLMAPGEAWQAWHRTWCSDVLDATAKLSRECLDFGRIVNAQTGAPGAGVYRDPIIAA
jgi:hypothetical protein